MNKRLTVMITAVVLLALLGAWSLRSNTPTPSARAQEEAASVQASEAQIGSATRIQLELLNKPPELTPQQEEARQLWLERGPLKSPDLPEGTTAVQRPDSVMDPSSETRAPSAEEQAALQAPTAPGDFELFRNSNLGAFIKSQSAYVTEPTVANSGPIVFATGNWWGAISRDGGQTFQYVNPFALFPASAGGFCCDQIAVYDPARDVFIWYLQYISSGSPGSWTNIFRMAVSHPSEALQGYWWYYDIVSAANTEWDYPDMCLSNDYLWVTTNRGPFQASYVNDAFMFKFPLDPMSIGAGFGFSYLDLGLAGLGNLSLRCTRGARETMYFGSHNTLSQVRIYRWAENSGTISWNDVNLSAAWFNSTHACPGPDGRSWCGFDDGRIKAGWVSQGRIGFMWGSSQGGGFAYPYVEAVRVRESDRTYIDRPYIWNSSGAFAYPAASPNARGDLGIAAFFGGGSYYPYFLVGIDDDISRDNGYPPPGWEVYYLRQSSQGPINNRWGDYISVQPFAPTSLGWIASGFTLQGCGDFSGCSESTYTIYGRERDLHSVTQYYNPRLSTLLPTTLR